MSLPHVVILGSGPAGLGAALQLRRRELAEVTVVERNGAPGGNAGSFELAGMRVDYGSHRLHPSCDPTILADLRALLGDDLLDRARHGRIRLHGRWLHFPLKPADLARGLPPRFTLGVLRDMVWRHRRPPSSPTFASVLESGLGATICREFYFPYAEKVWGVPPEDLAAIQAQRRVGANSFGKLLHKVAAAIPGLRGPGTGRFFYPRHGYGQISEALQRAAAAAGARFEFHAAVHAVSHADGRVQDVIFERDGRPIAIAADYVWSTLPVTHVLRMLTPAAPAALRDATERIAFRAMIVVYLVVEQERFSAYDAHYFPELSVRMSRLSEPKNYSGSGPAGRTVLCAELPCAPTDPEWDMSDEELGSVVVTAMEQAALPVRARISQIAVRRLRQAYPIYRAGYEQHFDRLDRYLAGFANLLTFGRQGLFAHDNTHHALAMGYAAASCVRRGGGFDAAGWHDHRRVFQTHVVED